MSENQKVSDKNVETKEICHHGIPMTETELAEYEAAFSEIDESIGLVMENGKDLQ